MSELCGCDYLECIEKRRATGGSEDCECGCKAFRCRSSEPPERHEFHMLDPWRAYCICGWTGDDRLLSERDSMTPAAFVGMLYRKHLE